MKKEKISDKLNFLKEVTSTTDEAFANKHAEKYPNEKDIQRNYQRYRKGDYDDREEWYGKKDKRKDWTIERIARTFGTSPEQIKHNPSFTKIVKVRMRLEGITNISDDSDLLEFNDDIEENEYKLEKIEREGIIKSIIEEYDDCDEMKILDCYKFLIFYNDYRKINDEAWNVIYSYSLLDKKEKEEFEKYIFSKNIFKIRKIERIYINKTDIKLLDEIYKKVRSNDENKIREYLRNQLKKNLNNDNTERIEFLQGIIKELSTLDSKDWELIEHYYSLNYTEQRDILEKCNTVIQKSNLN